MSSTHDSDGNDGTVCEAHARLRMFRSGRLHRRDGRYFTPDGAEVAARLVERWIADGYVAPTADPVMLNPIGIRALARPPRQDGGP